MKKIFFLLCLSFLTSALFAQVKSEDIVIENSEMRLVIGSDAKAKSLIYKATGEECLDTDAIVPISGITEYRPYDNELFLTYPAKERTFWSDTAYLDGDKLMVGYETIAYTATISLNITDGYIGFKLTHLDYVVEEMGVKRRTDIDEFVLMQLPIKKRKHFGEWLNVMWDEDLAVNLLATDMYAKIDARQDKKYNLLYAAMESQVKLMDVGAALITTKTDNLLDRIDRLERDYDLPLGVEGRRSEHYPYSYYELRGATPETIDEHIAYAKKGGFRMMVIYYPDFSTTMGHFPWNKDYPNGMEDLKKVIGKIKAAGMIAGFHIHYNKVERHDAYVTPVPDPRLNLVRMFTLSKPITTESTEIFVEENPEGCTLAKDRRILKIGNELITYENYTTTPPYKFTGCERGALNTTKYAFDYGFKFGLLDVDTWVKFIRVDQNTSIQEELAQNIAYLRNESGIDFVYFDGAEDVHTPYWYNVSRSQMKVYEKLDPKPLVSEGAIKSHFGWHILTRGNAFDIFLPEHIRPATDRYPLAAAEYIAQDFTSINFGWMGTTAPSDRTIGMQPDMYEYVCSRGTAWDGPISIVAKLNELRNHPRTDDNLEVMKNWEDARIQGYFTAEQKEELKRRGQEHILLRDEKGNFEMLPYEEIQEPAGKGKDVKAFVLERKGKAWLVYWHIRGEGTLTLDVNPSEVKLYSKIGKRASFKKAKGQVILPIDNRKYVEFNNKTIDEVKALVKQAVLTNK